MSIFFHFLWYNRLLLIRVKEALQIYNLSPKQNNTQNTPNSYYVRGTMFCVHHMHITSHYGQIMIACTHSSLYCWVSPSGNSPDGKSSTTGMDGGSVCSGTSFFFLHTMDGEPSPFRWKCLSERWIAKLDGGTHLLLFFFFFFFTTSAKTVLKCKQRHILVFHGINHLFNAKIHHFL